MLALASSFLSRWNGIRAEQDLHQPGERKISGKGRRGQTHAGRESEIWPWHIRQRWSASIRQTSSRRRQATSLAAKDNQSVSPLHLLLFLCFKPSLNGTGCLGKVCQGGRPATTASGPVDDLGRRHWSGLVRRRQARLCEQKQATVRAEDLRFPSPEQAQAARRRSAPLFLRGGRAFYFYFYFNSKGCWGRHRRKEGRRHRAQRYQSRRASFACVKGGIA